MSSVLELRCARSRAQVNLVYRLMLVGRRWRARLSERLVGAGQTDATFSALYALASAPSGLNQTELAERMGVTSSSLVRLLDLLELQGQIRREAMVGDRRANLIRLQPAGAAAVRELDTIADGLRNEVFEGVSDARLAEMSDLVDLFLDRLAPGAAHGKTGSADEATEPA